MANNSAFENLKGNGDAVVELLREIIGQAWIELAFKNNSFFGDKI